MLLRGSTVKVSISVLLVLVFLSFCFIYDYILHGEDYCHKKLLISRAKPMIKNPETLNTEDFISQYITLSEKVNSLHPGEKLVSFFHYFLDIHVTMKNKILIAVVTTEKYLLTRAVSIQKTWARDILPHSKLYFFVGEGCNTSHPKLKSLPIIKMRGIQDNIYPPQKKVFAVLTYIYLHFGRDFKWFIRADDDVYIRMDRLEALLDQLEWTELMYLGHPGYGKLSDRKRLKLLDHENYCMGGPGIVFSATALEALYPHLGRCLMAVEHYNFKKEQEIWWYNEDVELGRCVSRTLGIHCSPKIKVTSNYRSSLLSMSLPETYLIHCELNFTPEDEMPH